MMRVFFGFTFLIAAFFPIGGQIAQYLTGGMYGQVFKDLPPVYFHLLVLAASYVPAALITAWFFSAARLRERLPTPIPGAGFLFIGVLLSCIYIAARLYTSIIQGGGPSFVVIQFAPFLLWPARIVLVIGAVQMLLEARPSVTAIGQAIYTMPRTSR